MTIILKSAEKPLFRTGNGAAINISPKVIPGPAGKDGKDGAPGGSDASFAGWVDDTSSQTRASLDAAYAGVITPEAHGAKGDGITDDTAAVQAAFNAVPTTGGWVLLRGKYLISSKVSVPRKCRISGLGGFDSTFAWTSGLLCKTDAIDALSIDAHGCTVEDFVVSYEGTTRPTAGSGIRVTKGDFARLRGLGISGFWNDLQYDAGWYYSVSDCRIYDPVNYGIYLRNTESGGGDHGDQGIQNCIISKVRDTNNGGTAVRWESGGGLRFTGNKINAGTQVGYAGIGRWDYGLVLAPDDNITTGVFPITGNSIENALSACVRITTKTTTGPGAFISKVQIVGNEIAPFGASANGIQIDPGAVWNYADYVIASNSIVVQPGNKCIYVKNLDSFSIGQNRMRGDYHVWVSGGCSGFDIDSVTGNANGNLIYNQSADNAAWYSRPLADSRGIPSLGSGSPLNCWTVDMTNMNSGCVVEVTVSGRMIGTGGGPVVRTKQMFVTAAAGVPTVGTPYVDQKSGTSTLDVTATVSGSGVTYAVTHSDAGLTFRGTVNIRVVGPMFALACR